MPIKRGTGKGAGQRMLMQTFATGPRIPQRIGLLVEVDLWRRHVVVRIDGHDFRCHEKQIPHNADLVFDALREGMQVDCDETGRIFGLRP